jgi:transcriptional regulator GlxA family with amidase domain
MSHRIGIVLFDGVEELDAVGPWEVFAAWAAFKPEDAVEVSCLSPSGKPVEAAKGLTLTPHHGFDDATPYDVLLHPGGQGTRPLMRDEAHLDWVRKQRAAVPLMTSVCTGSLVYAAAGLLRDRPATTHWGALELLAETDPSIEIRPDDRYVDDGDVITSAGVSAGIDMALHVVRRLVGDQTARDVRRYIQYDPEPPV